PEEHCRTVHSLPRRLPLMERWVLLQGLARVKGNNRCLNRESWIVNRGSRRIVPLRFTIHDSQSCASSLSSFPARTRYSQAWTALRLSRKAAHIACVSSKLILSGAVECSTAIRGDICMSTWKGEIMRLDELLVSRHITFQRLPHRRTYAANRVAQALHVKGRE